jgi:hypothetical protein
MFIQAFFPRLVSCLLFHLARVFVVGWLTVGELPIRVDVGNELLSWSSPTDAAGNDRRASVTSCIQILQLKNVAVLYQRQWSLKRSTA